MALIRARRRQSIVLAAVVVAVMLVFTVSVCRSWSVGHMPSTEEEARDYQEMKSKMREKDEKDQSPETWTEWAKDKISGGLGLKNDERHGIENGGVKKVTDLTSDAAAKAKDKIENVASEVGQYGAEKAKEMKETAAEKAGKAKEKASEVAEMAKETAAEKTKEAAEKAKEQAYNAAKAGKEKTTTLKNKAEETSGEAAEKAKEAAEETATAAKEKSQRIKEDVVGSDDEL